MGNFAQAYLELAKPILFNTLMVQAILQDRKTQTRRVIDKDISNSFDIDVDGKVIAYIDQSTGDWYDPENLAKYKVGDTLRVRETWAKVSDWTDVDPEVGLFDGYIYKADWGSIEHPNWKPSIFMPKEAARLFLEVLDVRVERLQDISEKDVFEEGCRIGKTIKWDDLIPDLRTMNKELMFIPLWDSINKKRGYGWETNPFIWVYEFKKVGSYKINVKWGDVDG